MAMAEKSSKKCYLAHFLYLTYVLYQHIISSKGTWELWSRKLSRESILGAADCHKSRYGIYCESLCELTYLQF